MFENLIGMYCDISYNIIIIFFQILRLVKLNEICELFYKINNNHNNYGNTIIILMVFFFYLVEFAVFLIINNSYRY